MAGFPLDPVHWGQRPGLPICYGTGGVLFLSLFSNVVSSSLAVGSGLLSCQPPEARRPASLAVHSKLNGVMEPLDVVHGV